MPVDRSELNTLIRDLGAVPPALRRELRPGFMKAGQPVLQEMRRRASWSTRIPDATSMALSTTTLGVLFRVSSGRAQDARPIEHDGAPGMFRHPVYARGDRNRWTWRDQAARPFFYGSVTDKADQVVDAIGDIVARVAEDHGF
jgi:hypothetical protein